MISVSVYEPHIGNKTKRNKTKTKKNIRKMNNFTYLLLIFFCIFRIQGILMRMMNDRIEQYLKRTILSEMETFSKDLAEIFRSPQAMNISDPLVKYESVINEVLQFLDKKDEGTRHMQSEHDDLLHNH